MDTDLEEGGTLELDLQEGIVLDADLEDGIELAGTRRADGGARWGQRRWGGRELGWMYEKMRGGESD